MSKSHSYEFTGADVFALLALPLVPLGLFAVALQLGAATHLLPPPCPALDTDRTILIHQAQTSRERRPGDLVLVGDSSCLMDVSAIQLGASLPGGRAVLNLGTLSYLDLPAFARLLQNFAAANPNQIKTVVLLMHPEALRRLSPAEYDVQALAHFYSGTDFCGPATSRTLCALGIEIFKGRFLSRAVPQPLPGAFGRFYGFSHDLWRYLSDHQGSALDPGKFDPAHIQGNAEYRLAKPLESASSEFRSAVPAGARFFVGITPVPATFAPPKYAETHQRLLLTWSGWLRTATNGALLELPAVMADDLFASTTHLNQRGVQHYTELLQRALASRADP